MRDALIVLSCAAGVLFYFGIIVAWVATRFVRVNVTVQCVHNDEDEPEGDEDEIDDTPDVGETKPTEPTERVN